MRKNESSSRKKRSRDVFSTEFHFFVPSPNFRFFLDAACSILFQYTRKFFTQPNSTEIALIVFQIAEVREKWDRLWGGSRFSLVSVPMRMLVLHKLLVKFSRTLLKDRVDANSTQNNTTQSFRNSISASKTKSLQAVCKWASDSSDEDEEYEPEEGEEEATTPRILPPRKLERPPRYRSLSQLVGTSSEDDEGDSSDEEFEVARILDHRLDEEGNTEYLVEWSGYPESANSWEPVNNLLDCSCFLEYVSSQ
jgi:hypothetical protein